MTPGPAASGGDAVDAAEVRFRRLYDAHLRAVLGYAVRRAANPDDAADVAAETMLVAWRRIDDVPADGGERPWLFGVARRLLANQRRGVRRRSDLAERLRLHVRRAFDAAVDERITSSASVVAALEALGEDERELVLLTVWEGLTPAEAAAVLDVPPSTARSRLQRARSKLRAVLTSAEGAEVASSGHAAVEVRGDHR